MAECMNNFHGVEVWTAVIALDMFCQLAMHTHRCITHLVLAQHFDELHVAIASPFWMVALVTALMDIVWLSVGLLLASEVPLDDTRVSMLHNNLHVELDCRNDR